MSSTTATHAEALRWLAEFVPQLGEAEIVPIAERIRDDVAAEMPELEGADLRDDLYALARDGVRSFFAVLPLEPWQDPVVPVVAVELSRALARRGHDVGTLFTVYRLGQDAFWRTTMRASERHIADPEVRMQVLFVMWQRLGRWIEFVLNSQVVAFDEERDRWQRGALARRAETMQAILAGEPLDEAQAGSILGHDLRRCQTGLALWADAEGDGSAAIGRLEAVAAELAQQLGARKALTFSNGARGLWAWIGTDAEPDLSLLERAPALAGAPSVRVAAGQPARGMSGFRESHREALEAQRIATASRRRRAVTRYADVELVSLVSRDERAARALVRRELGDLAARGRSAERLRDTALAFLACGGNARVAADALGTHKNTVLYRLKRLEELLGYPVEVRRLPLEVALMLVDAFGERMLPDEPPARR